MKLIYLALVGLSLVTGVSINEVKSVCGADTAKFLKKNKKFKPATRCFDYDYIYHRFAVKNFREWGLDTVFNDCYGEFVARKVNRGLKKGTIDQETIDEGTNKLKQCLDLFYNHYAPEIEDRLREYPCSEDGEWQRSSDFAPYASIVGKAVAIKDYQGSFVNVFPITAGAQLRLTAIDSDQSLTPAKFMIDPFSYWLKDDLRSYRFFFFIRSAADPTLCLDAPNFSAGAKIQLMPCKDDKDPNNDDLSNQLWEIEDASRWFSEAKFPWKEGKISWVFRSKASRRNVMKNGIRVLMTGIRTSTLNHLTIDDYMVALFSGRQTPAFIFDLE